MIYASICNSIFVGCAYGKASNGCIMRRMIQTTAIVSNLVHMSRVDSINDVIVPNMSDVALVVDHVTFTLV